MRKVAIVEDDPELLKVYGQLLKLKGYNVVLTLNSGDEVLNELSKAPVMPDVLIIGMDINEVTIRKIKAGYPNIEIKMIKSEDEWHNPVNMQSLLKF